MSRLTLDNSSFRINFNTIEHQLLSLSQTNEFNHVTEKVDKILRELDKITSKLDQNAQTRVNKGWNGIKQMQLEADFRHKYSNGSVEQEKKAIVKEIRKLLRNEFNWKGDKWKMPNLRLIDKVSAMVRSIRHFLDGLGKKQLSAFK